MRLQLATVHAVNGRLGVWCKAPAGVRLFWWQRRQKRFFRAPYLGSKGWIGLWLNDPDWQEVAGLIARS